MSREYFVGKKKWQLAVVPHPDCTVAGLACRASGMSTAMTHYPV
jgi:hypothetical protein